MRTRPVFMRMLGTALAIGATSRSAALEPVAKGAELRAQYGTQGFFMSQPMAVENESVTFHARATGAGPEPAGRLVIEDSAGAVVQEAPLAFTRDGERTDRSFDFRGVLGGTGGANVGPHCLSISKCSRHDVSRREDGSRRRRSGGGQGGGGHASGGAGGAGAARRPGTAEGG